MTEIIYRSMTYHNVARDLGERPCTDDFKQACEVLPNWKSTAYTPSEMAAHGVKHSSIIWAWMRPQAMGREAMVEAACRIAERVLPIYEAAHPGDDRPHKAIEAARRVARDRSKKNKDAARAAADAAAWNTAWVARAAAEAARAAVWAAVWAAADAANAAIEAAESAADAAARAAKADDEQRAQIAIIEAVMAEYEQTAEQAN